VLCCTAVCCAVLQCAVLWCDVMCCAVLYCPVQRLCLPSSLSLNSSPLSSLLSPPSYPLCSDNAIAVKTKARNMSSDTLPYVRHKLHIVRCESFISGPPLLALSVDPWNQVRNMNTCATIYRTVMILSLSVSLILLH
jgi:hypothetical protein